MLTTTEKNIVLDEITYLIVTYNTKILLMEKEERYEEAAGLRDSLNTLLIAGTENFIDAPNLPVEDYDAAFNNVYTQFQEQSQFIREELKKNKK